MQLDTVAFPPVAESSWRQDSATFVLEPDDPTDGSFFDRLRQQRKHVIVAFASNAGIGDISSVEHIVSGGRQKWRIEFPQLQTDSSTTMEMGTSGTSAEQFAEIRARRILLNENRYEPTQDYNKVMREILIQGQDELIKIERTPFQPLYKAYGSEPSKFLQIAWITAAMQLKVSRTVASIEVLRLRLKDSILAVTFRGTRARKYSNVDPHVIQVEGEIVLRQ